MIEDIILLGSGGHAKACIDVIEQANNFNIIGMVDNKFKGNTLGYPVIGTDDDLRSLREHYKNSKIDSLSSSSPLEISTFIV